MFDIVCVCMCTSVCIEDQSYGGTNTIYVHRMGHATTCTCTHVQSKEDLQRTSHVGTPHA